MNFWIKLIVLGVMGVGSLWVGQRGFTDEKSVEIVANWGYWFILVIGGIWSYFIYNFLKGRVSEVTEWAKKVTLRWLMIYGITVLGVFYVVEHYEEKSFKINLDEPCLVGTSMSMHYNRKPLVPYIGYEIEGTYRVMQGCLDKRPLLFPFLLSIVHDLQGYDIKNVYLLNQILTVILILMVMVIGEIYGRGVGVFGGWSLCLIPLLIQCANSGGFEILNLVLILLCFYLSYHYLKNPDKKNLNILWFSGIALSNVRYESVLYLLPIVCVIIQGWVKTRKWELSWGVCFSPILFIPYLLQHRLFEFDKDLWQLSDRPGLTEPFSLEYIACNLKYAVHAIFEYSGHLPGAPVLGFFGVIGFFLFLTHMIQKLIRKEEYNKGEFILLAYVMGFLGNFFLLMIYFYGQLDDLVVTRLVLPVYLGMVLVCGYIVSRYLEYLKWVISGMVGLWWVSVVPILNNRYYNGLLLPQRETKYVEAASKWISKERWELVLSDRSVLWILHKVNSIPLTYALENRGKIEGLMGIPGVEMYASTSRMYDIRVGEFRADIEPRDYFELGEEKESRLFFPGTKMNLEKIIGIKAWDNVDFREKINEARLYKAQHMPKWGYLEGVIKKLP